MSSKVFLNINEMNSFGFFIHCLGRGTNAAVHTKTGTNVYIPGANACHSHNWDWEVGGLSACPTQATLESVLSNHHTVGL